MAALHQPHLHLELSWRLCAKIVQSTQQEYLPLAESQNCSFSWQQLATARPRFVTQLSYKVTGSSARFSWKGGKQSNWTKRQGAGNKDRKEVLQAVFLDSSLHICLTTQREKETEEDEEGDDETQEDDEEEEEEEDEDGEDDEDWQGCCSA